MAYGHGKKTTVTINSVAHAFRNYKISQQSANGETTNFNTNGDWDSIDGVHSVTVSGDIFFDPANTYFGSGSTFVEGSAQTITIAQTEGANTKTLGVTIRWDTIDWNFDVQGAVVATVSGKGKITSRWA